MRRLSGLALGAILAFPLAIRAVEIKPGANPAAKTELQTASLARYPETSDEFPGWLPWAAMLAAGLYLAIYLVRRRAGGDSAGAAQNLFSPPSGLSTDHFAIVRRLGEGGMGVVYEAVDRSLNRKVAIKKMRDDLKEKSADYAQFLKEAKTVAALHHPHIVDIHSIVSQGGETYMVFEFVEGKTVAVLLQEKGRFSLKQAKHILHPIALALDYAHGRQVIHRDLKPANVMVTADGLVKVMDFGIARQLKDPLNAAREDAPHHLVTGVLGTPSYMAPEADQGVIFPQSDIYSMGVMAYEMLAGETPFPASSEIPMMERKLGRQYQPLSQRLSGLPEGLDSLIDQTLEPDPKTRLSSARRFWEILDRLV